MCFVGFPAVAADQTPADAALDWGLIGTWASNCGAPSSKENPFYSYVREGKTLVVKRETGQGSDANEVISAKLFNENEIEVTTDFKAFSRIMTGHYVKIGKDTFSPSSNVDDKGLYTIKDGRQTRSGSPAPIMKRC